MGNDPTAAGGPTRRPTVGWARWCILALSVLLLLTAGYWVRIAVQSRSHVAMGDEAREAGDIESAVLHYRHGLESHVPLGGASAVALDRLITTGDEMSRVGNREVALFALHSARQGILAVRHVVYPFEDGLPEINRRITDLAAEDARSRGTGIAPASAELLGGYRARRVLLQMRRMGLPRR